MKLRLLRLCTVRTVSTGFGDLGIKNDLAFYVSLVVDVVLSPFSLGGFSFAGGGMVLVVWFWFLE